MYKVDKEVEEKHERTFRPRPRASWSEKKQEQKRIKRLVESVRSIIQEKK